MTTLPPHAQDDKPSSHIPTTPGIYKITCVATHKIYVGSSVNLQKRKRDHFYELRRSKHRNILLQRAWNKYGEQAFIFEVLELVSTAEMLITREQYWFDELKPFGDTGFNIALEAGHRVRLGRKHTPETCAKMGLANLGNKYRLGKKATPETLEKLRDSHRGKPSTFKDKHHTPEARKKMGTNLGKKRSPEAIEKGRQSNTGKKRTPEQVERFKQAQQKSRAEMKSTSSTGLRGISVYQKKRNDRIESTTYKFSCQCKDCKITKYFPYTEEGLEEARVFAEAHYAAMKPTL